MTNINSITINQETNNNSIESKYLAKDNSIHESGKTPSFSKAYEVSSANSLFDNYTDRSDSKKQIAELIDEKSPKASKDQMVLLAHTMTSADYARFEDEGFDINALEAEQIVTVMDKIKLDLIDAGVEIEGYTDQISDDKVKDILGSDPRSHESTEFIKNELEASKLPASDYNISCVADSLEKGLSLRAFSESDLVNYINQNGNTTINSLHKIQSTNLPNSQTRSGVFYQSEAKGYLNKKANSQSMDALMPQIEKIINDSALELNEDTINEAKWLISHDLPLNSDSLNNYHIASNLPLPCDVNQLLNNIITSMKNNISPDDTDISGKNNKYLNALENKESILNRLDDLESSTKNINTADNVSYLRSIEEIRLSMTSQVSYFINKNNINLDFNDLINTVDTLKDIERQLLSSYTANGSTILEGEMELFTETSLKVGDIAGAHASLVGKMSANISFVTLNDIHASAVSISVDITAKYEQVMTMPSSEYGDSIAKAFQNTSDILNELGMEITANNKRAVRILGYNQMEITRENISEVKLADITLQDVLKKMTPAKTMSLIKDGINPLNITLEELDSHLNNTDNFVRDTENYAKFLHRLDMKKDITSEEREAYIGIYRLIKSVEKSDGALVGQLLNEGADINLKNLLKASRTSKKQGLDIKLDEDFGLLTEVNRDEPTISQQIENYYNKLVQEIVSDDTPSYTSEVEIDLEMSLEKFTEQLDLAKGASSDTAIYNDLSNQLREVSLVSDKAFELLANNDQPINFQNIFSANAMVNESGNYLKDIYKKTKDDKANLLKASEEFISKFESVEDAINGYDEMISHFKDVYTNVSENEITDEESALDMSFRYKQLSLAVNLSHSENYEVPIEVFDEMSTMNIRFLHNKSKTSSIAITLSLKEDENICGYFEVKSNKVLGHLVTNNDDNMSFVNKLKDNFCERLKGLDLVGDDIQSFVSSNLDIHSFYSQKYFKNEDNDTNKLYQVAKQFMLATNKER